MSNNLRTRLILLLMMCAITIPVAGALDTNEQQKAQQVDAGKFIENKTQALQVVSVTNAGGAEEAHPILKITVLNISGKGVVDYTFIKEDGSTLTTSGATTGWILGAGQTDTVTVSVDPVRGEKLTLSALLLEDNTGEGDAQEVLRMRDYRSGIEEQFLRATPILRQAKAALESRETSIVLKDLQSQISALPETTEVDISPGRMSGKQHAKQFILRQVKEPKANISHTLARVEKALAKIQGKASNLQRH